jgi:hypothetical protein
MKNKTVEWITLTAVFIALLVALQAAAAPLGQFLVGPLNNMVFILATLTGGLASGLAAAALSPVAATLLGIGPLWPLVPFIILGNMTIVAVWYVLRRRRLIALFAGAAAKFIVLYAGIVLVAVPLILRLPQPQASVVSAMFSWPQLLTALAGGGLALALLPVVEKIRGKR